TPSRCRRSRPAGRRVAPGPAASRSPTGRTAAACRRAPAALLVPLPLPLPLPARRDRASRDIRARYAPMLPARRAGRPRCRWWRARAVLVPQHREQSGIRWLRVRSRLLRVPRGRPVSRPNGYPRARCRVAAVVRRPAGNTTRVSRPRPPGRERRRGLAGAGGPTGPPAGGVLPAVGRAGVPGETRPRRVDLDHAPLHTHAPDRRRGADGLQDRYEAGTPARGAHDVKGFPLPLSRPAGPLRPHQLALEREERPECASAGGQLERDRRCTVGNELLYARHEVVRELPRSPRPPPHVPRPAEVPWQLEHVLGATRQVHHIEQVPRPGNERARDLLVAAANPGPLAHRVECLAHRA